MQRRRHRPPKDGPLCNTTYLFPPAPCVRLPGKGKPGAKLEPRGPIPWRCPVDMFRHPLDAPMWSIERDAPSRVSFCVRVSVFEYERHVTSDDAADEADIEAFWQRVQPDLEPAVPPVGATNDAE